MIEELLAGETDWARIAELAPGAMRTKIPQLQEALDGYLLLHQRKMLRVQLSQYDSLGGAITARENAIEIYARPLPARWSNWTRFRALIVLPPPPY
jgi:hypothetical protein